MSTKALVVIDIQNDITKHYRDIIEVPKNAFNSSAVFPSTFPNGV